MALALFLPKDIWFKMGFKECCPLRAKSSVELQQHWFPWCWNGGESNQTNCSSALRGDLSPTSATAFINQELGVSDEPFHPGLFQLLSLWISSEFKASVPSSSLHLPSAAAAHAGLSWFWCLFPALIPQFRVLSPGLWVCCVSGGWHRALQELSLLLEDPLRLTPTCSKLTIMFFPTCEQKGEWSLHSAGLKESLTPPMSECPKSPFPPCSKAKPFQAGWRGAGMDLAACVCVLVLQNKVILGAWVKKSPWDSSWRWLLPWNLDS